jgi:hypothetical protein
MIMCLCTALPVKLLAKKIHRGLATSYLLARSRSVDFFLFPSMKNPLRGSHFETVDEGQKVTTSILNNLKEKDFKKCFNSRKQRRNSCTAAEGTTKKATCV